ncbi:MAG: STAS domain-containing protein [Candidatus Latescibacteria bacterium]|nr:STAS domain-containing protein [bacterium]MCB9515230.1 STAS domain-containing protein [Candidatus Latescibacterota bacterium]
MEIRSTEQGDAVVLSVKGEIEVYSLPEFSRMAEGYLGGPQTLILDLDGLEYIDSSGLGFLVTLHERMERKGQKLRLTNLRNHVGRVFKITRLDQILDIQPEEAPAS